MILTLILTAIAYLLSGFFSASETALFSIPREQRQTLKGGSKKEQKIAILLDRGEETLILILLGNLFVNISAISLTTKLLSDLGVTSMALIVLYTTLLLLIFGEIIPKNIAILNILPFARSTSTPLLLFLKILSPLIHLLKHFNHTLLKLNYRYLLQSPAPFITPSEYLHAIEESVKQKRLTPTSGTIIRSYLELSDKSISLIAIHRSRLENRKDGSNYTLEKKGDTITAIISTHARSTQREREVADWFPITQDLGTLHEFFVKEKRKMVLLTDEYGDFYGIATRKDLYHFWQNSFQTDTNTHLRTTILRGNTPLVNVREWFPSELLAHYDECKTVNGLLTAWLETIPKEGETAQFQSYIFDFIEVDPNRIVRVSIQKEQIHAK